MPALKQTVVVTHWVPIITICPVNNLPDLLYVEVTYDDGKLHELYAVRREIKRGMFLKRAFMEEIAQEMAARFGDACAVKVRLAFNKHVVTITPE